MKKTKNKTIILLIVITFFIFPIKIYAVLGNCHDYTSHMTGGGGSGGNYDDGGGGGGDPNCPGDAIRKVTCNAKYDRNEESMLLKEDLYDTNGHFMGSATLLQNKIALVSGRFVGIDAYEEYKKTVYVTINPVCREGRYETETVCVYHYVECYTQTGVPINCGYTECYSYTVLRCYPCDVKYSDWENQCRPEAEAVLNEEINKVDKKPSYKAYRQDVNDINEGVSGDNPTIEVYPLSEPIVRTSEVEPSAKNSSTVWQSVTVINEYNLTPAWMNPDNGKVKYESPVPKDQVTEADKQNYIEVPPTQVARWGTTIRAGQYFVPLNAKSTDKLRYYLKPNLSKQKISEAMCNALIDKYNRKTDYDEYWGDFLAQANGEPMSRVASTAAQAKQIVKRDHGCRMGLYIAFRIKQEMYNDKLTGYNYYYRPIDYSEPFPNGLSTDSFWNGVYDIKSNKITVKNSKKEIDLDDSFAKVTYETNSNYKVNTIRSYNSNIKYTDWSKMNANGTSSFISGNYGISRKECQSFYRLGCGPANANWTQCKINEAKVCSA